MSHTGSCTKCRTRLAGLLGLGCLAVVLTASAGSTAHAQASDKNWFDRKLFESALKGLGLGDSGPDIDYRERSPLVIPPSRDLPPPGSTAAAVQKNPEWPKDPDVQARLDAERERDKPNNALISDPFERNGRPLSRDELEKGRVARGSTRRAAASPDRVQNPGYTGSPLLPDSLGKKSIFGSLFGGSEKQEAVRFNGEPQRSSLIEPPPGYRTPSPNEPYGINTPKKNNAYVPTVEDRGVVR